MQAAELRVGDEIDRERLSDCTTAVGIQMGVAQVVGRCLPLGPAQHGQQVEAAHLELLAEGQDPLLG